jgi:hypothetical protein
VKTVLILSGAEDETARMVAERLKAYPVRVAAFDIADFPLRVEFAAFPGNGGSLGTVHTSDGTVDLDDVVGVLYRRPALFRMPEGSACRRACSISTEYLRESKRGMDSVVS